MSAPIRVVPPRRDFEPLAPAVRTSQWVAIAVLVPLLLLGVVAYVDSPSSLVHLQGFIMAAFVVVGVAFVVRVLTYQREGALVVETTPSSLVFAAPAWWQTFMWVGSGLAIAFAVPSVVAMATGRLAELPLYGRIGPLVVAVIAVFEAIRTWPMRGPRVELDADGVQLAGSGKATHVGWDDVHVTVVRRRVFVGPTVGYGLRDLASDGRLLGEVIEFYARHPRDRAELGQRAVPRLESGDF